MPNTYTIQHISDLLTVPPEDIEEVLADVRAAYDIARATLHAMRELGSKGTNLCEFMPEVTSVCDGKAEHKVELRARP